MIRFAVVAALMGACVANKADSPWELYKSVHGKQYSAAEDSNRLSIFNKNLNRINEHNLRYDLGLTSYRLGLNKFADMSNEEFLHYKGLRFNATTKTLRGSALSPTTSNVPASVDWRTKGYVTPVKNQGQCGSCWAFSTTGSLEGQHFAKTGKLVSLSEQNLVDCSGDFGNYGCSGGIMDQAFQYIKANGGIDTEEGYPYVGTDQTCHFKKELVGATVRGFVDVPSKNEEALKKAVGTVGPVSVAIDASQGTFQLYSQGIYDEPNCSSDQLDHGVLVVGYGTENGKDFWIVKNSWGTGWGDNGYIRMSRNKENQCGIATHASYPLV